MKATQLQLSFITESTRDSISFGSRCNGRPHPMGPVLPIFEQSFTVHAVDRRGRGGRGDAELYAVEREFEDIVAVVNSIAEPVFLLGHSNGAIFCLEAACRTKHERKLVLYEPPIPFPTGIELYPSEMKCRIQTLLDGGD